MTGILFQTLRDGWSTLTETWESLNMKFGLRLAGALLGSAAVVQSQCPDYTTFSQVCHSTQYEIRSLGLNLECIDETKSPQGNRSTGPLALPYMRPAPACRTFNSSAVEVT